MVTYIETIFLIQSSVRLYRCCAQILVLFSVYFADIILFVGSHYVLTYSTAGPSMYAFVDVFIGCVLSL